MSHYTVPHRKHQAIISCSSAPAPACRSVASGSIHTAKEPVIIFTGPACRKSAEGTFPRICTLSLVGPQAALPAVRSCKEAILQAKSRKNRRAGASPRLIAPKGLADFRFTVCRRRVTMTFFDILSRCSYSPAVRSKSCEEHTPVFSGMRSGLSPTSGSDGLPSPGIVSARLISGDGR